MRLFIWIGTGVRLPSAPFLRALFLRAPSRPEFRFSFTGAFAFKKTETVCAVERTSRASSAGGRLRLLSKHSWTDRVGRRGCLSAGRSLSRPSRFRFPSIAIPLPIHRDSASHPSRLRFPSIAIPLPSHRDSASHPSRLRFPSIAIPLPIHRDSASHPSRLRFPSIAIPLPIHRDRLSWPCIAH